jgi:hypothetical protein
VIQWFTVLFTGKRNQGMFDFQNQWLHYALRAYSYAGLLYDEYPKFGTDASGVPMRSSLAYDEPANRLTNGLRFIWAIPAMIIGYALAIAGEVVAIILWFVIVITGKSNQGMWDFVKKVQHYVSQAYAYVLLMTDQYPKYPSTASAPAPLPGPVPGTGPVA